MDKADIQAFLAVSQYGTISKAAERLYISHSTLSWRINKLEDEIGAELFERGKGLKRAELTKAGNIFHPYASKLLDTWQEAITAMGKVSESSLSVVIGHNHNLLFNNVYKEFSIEYPEIPLYLLLRHSDDAYGFVKSGEMDAGFVAVDRHMDKIQSIPLCKEQFVFICGNKCDFSTEQVITPENLRAENEIKWWTAPSGVAEWQKKWIGDEPKWVVQDDPHTLESLLDESNLWTVVPASTAETFVSRCKGGILIKDLDFECPSRDIFIVIRECAKPTAALREFLYIMKKDFTSRGIEWLLNEI